MMYVIMDKDEIYKKFENNFVGIRDKFESYVLLLKINGYSDAMFTVTAGKDKTRHMVYRYHLLREKGCKILTLYYDEIDNKLSVRNILNNTGRLMLNTNKVFIDSIDDLDHFVSKVI